VAQPPDFDALYASSTDPWQVSSRWYEIRKLSIALASLTRTSYVNAWDPACGSGVAAIKLADRADLVLATDSSSAAVQITAERASHNPRIRVLQSALPDAPFALRRPLALIFVSEVLYYLDEQARLAAYRLWDDVTEPGSELMAIHWRPRPDDGFASGDDVQAELAGYLTGRDWQTVVVHADAEFVINSFVKGDQRVAE
jgi:chemotaxis methyl-accepting protein methylase